MRARSGSPRAAMVRMIWMNGELRPLDETAVSPFDHGITVGDGVFETLISYAGAPFAFTRHHQRLGHSAAGMGLEVPSREGLREACVALLEANDLTGCLARLRITVTGGPAPLGSERGESPPTVMVAATAAPDLGATAKVVVVPFTRNETGALAGLKTTSYGENVVALAYARERGGGEAIFANTRGELCEGTGTNIFLVRDDRLLTPPLSSGCLAGVTRALVLGLCAQEGIPVAEETMPLTALRESKEAFLTSTTREVQPIETVDGSPLPDVPGPLTARLRAAFRSLATREIDP